MALPDGVLTVTVEFGPYLDDNGNPYTGTVQFWSSTPRVWAATGAPILPRPIVVPLGIDGTGSVVLAATDEDGFTDGAGNSVTDWTYDVETRLAGRVGIRSTFALPALGVQGLTVDLDELVPVRSSAGTTVALPAVSSVSVNGQAQTGAVEIEVPPVAVRSSVVATIGDSITAQNASYTESYAKLGPSMAGANVSHFRVYAVGGYVLQDLHDNLLPQVLAMDPLPISCLIAGGTNDSSTPAQLAATLETITDPLVAAGITPILWCPPPRSNVAGNVTQAAAVAAWCAYVRRLGVAKGWPVLDAQALLAGSDGYLAAEYIPAQQGTPGDGIHPNMSGHVVLARAYAAILKELIPAQPSALLQSPIDPDISAGVGLFLNDSNSDGYADGTIHSGTLGAPSIVPGAAVGNWQRTSIAAGGGVGGSITIDVAGLTAGHTYLIGFALQASLDGPGAGTVGGVTMTWRSAAGNNGTPAPDPDNIEPGHTGRSLCMVTEADGPMYFHFVATAPSATTGLRAQLGFTGTAAVAAGYVQISQYTVRDLTALGID